MVVQVSINELVLALNEANLLWIVVPIFFVGIVTDKYQEEFGTDLGNAISNGAMVIFTGFTWLQIIEMRINYPENFILSQYLFTAFIIIYGFAIMVSGFRKSEFALKYGRTRVLTFMLMFFSMMIYTPLMYNFVSILLFVLLFPFYYAFITELIKVLPNLDDTTPVKEKPTVNYENRKLIHIGKEKLKEYLE